MLVWLLDLICAYLSFSFLDKGMFKISIWDFFPIDLHVAQSKDFHNAANHKTWWIMQFKYLYPQKQICTQAFVLYIWDFTCSETYSVFLRLVIVAQIHMNSHIYVHRIRHPAGHVHMSYKWQFCHLQDTLSTNHFCQIEIWLLLKRLLLTGSNLSRVLLWALYYQCVTFSGFSFGACTKLDITRNDFHKISQFWHSNGYYRLKYHVFDSWTTVSYTT